MSVVDPLATYTLRDVAALLRVSERYVRDELVTGRRIAHLHVGPKVVRFTRDQLEDFYADVTVGLPQAAALTVVADLPGWKAA